MAFESLTDIQIKELIDCPKKLINPNSRVKQKDGHEQYNYKAISTDGSDREFIVYKRQNIRVGMEDDFSAGLAWLAPNGEVFTLKRYNGSSHEHLNFIEKEKLDFKCHIHIATEKYIKANRKPEGFAESTEKYCTVNGAFHALIIDCNISGIVTTPEISNQTKLF